MLIATFSIAVFSCSDDKDDELNSPSKSQVSKATAEQIKATFPGLRLDSLQSHEEYGNLKLEYKNGLLVTYKECYTNGQVHDGVSFKLNYTPDTVYVNSYKAVIGENGLVRQLICPNGKVNRYNYDNQGHLIKYEVDVVDKQDKQYYEIKWENDNISSYRNNYQSEGSWKFVDIFYNYSEELNLAGILPFLRFSGYNWINDVGLSVCYGINEVLYYAGLLGRGTKNLPESSYKINDSKWNESCSFTYNLDEAGYVISESGTRKVGSWSDKTITDNYFYK